MSRVFDEFVGYFNGMPEILRAKINWTGFIGAPGYTNLYFSEFTTDGYTQAHADGATAKVQTFVSNIKNYLPSSVFIGQDPVIDIVQSDTGNLVGFFSVTVAAPVAGGQPGAFSAASGACINWGTNGVRNGRRVRGRTFIVPLAGNQYDTAGTILDASLLPLRNNANALIATSGITDFGVWSRPSGPGATDGVWYPAETSSVRDKVAVLRSRRD